MDLGKAPFLGQPKNSSRKPTTQTHIHSQSEFKLASFMLLKAFLAFKE